MTIAWIDAGAGVAGDMLLGALLHAGADLTVVRRAVAAVDPRLAVTVEPTERHSLQAVKATVLDTATGAAADSPAAAHHHQHHRTWAQVRELLDAADLVEEVREKALQVFAALARAEADVHGVRPEEVHFHEVGALDAIGDIVGCAAALHDLGIAELVCSPLTLGWGDQATGEHGRVPIPGPAVLRLVRDGNVPVQGGPVAAEMTTPTGAALVASWCTGFGPMPAMVIDRIGVGAGSRDLPELANVCRLVLGTPAQLHLPPLPTAEPDTAALAVGEPLGIPILIETNVDDLDPRLWPGVLDKLFDVGVADAWLTPVLMKKGRPGHMLTVLCRDDQRESVLTVMARETTTIGMRELSVVRKHELPRTMVRVDVEGQLIAVKIASLHGYPVNAQPEYRDVARAADELGRPVKEIMALAIAAYWAQPG
ncbi:nickel pincer cofactor biosynthesis protein LarC [Granulicoccus phenolivorans]|uniref:nickel pincer cofactor biosynthesis protein LarC n=1 Tax=Granulicoccus phenolivorans TaxID=266854 RepID=UPI000407F550|nr:nickel pincer cofactor biosynthesis protein LarC [Granulicoccus phenolivorans]